MIIGYVLYRRGLGLHDNSVRTLQDMCGFSAT